MDLHSLPTILNIKVPILHMNSWHQQQEEETQFHISLIGAFRPTPFPMVMLIEMLNFSYVKIM
jgi:hypothetical protein